MQRSLLGTQLRHLVELLDKAVQEAYEAAGLAYRPRYTPIVSVLLQRKACTIGDIANAANVTQPAATQTVALMIEDGLVSALPGPTDARRRMITLTARAQRLLPKLQRCWQATAMAHADLEMELGFSLSEALGRAIAVLEAKPYGARIREAQATLQPKIPSKTRRTTPAGV